MTTANVSVDHLRFKHGSPQFLDHNPQGAVAANDVVVVGDMVLIAHNAIAANQPANRPGALASGGGVYDGIGDGVIANGKKVYWDEATGKVTETSSGNKGLGFCGSGIADACTGDGQPIRVVHRPF